MMAAARTRTKRLTKREGDQFVRCHSNQVSGWNYEIVVQSTFFYNFIIRVFALANLLFTVLFWRVCMIVVWHE